MTFSEKLVRLRKLKGITQDEFASAVGVSRQAVYKWESGQSYPEVPKLIEMKLLFGISIDDLLDESYEVVMPEKKTVRKRREAVKVTLTPPTDAIPAVAADTVTAAAVPAEEKEVAVELDAPAEEEPIAKTEDKTEPEAVQPEAVVAEPEKKRGFFSRLFRR